MFIAGTNIWMYLGLGQIVAYDLAGHEELDVVKDAVKSLDGSAGHLQHDVHLLDGELEHDGPQRAVVEQVAMELLVHGHEFQ